MLCKVEFINQPGAGKIINLEPIRRSRRRFIDQILVIALHYQRGTALFLLMAIIRRIIQSSTGLRGYVDVLTRDARHLDLGMLADALELDIKDRRLNGDNLRNDMQRRWHSLTTRHRRLSRHLGLTWNSLRRRWLSSRLRCLLECRYHPLVFADKFYLIAFWATGQPSPLSILLERLLKIMATDSQRMTRYT